jgi:hypothetical protein
MNVAFAVCISKSISRCLLTKKNPDCWCKLIRCCLRTSFLENLWKFSFACRAETKFRSFSRCMPRSTFVMQTDWYLWTHFRWRWRIEQ